VTPLVVVSRDAAGDQFLATSRRAASNVTGVAATFPGEVGRRLELIKTVFPGASRVAVLRNPDGAEGAGPLRAARAAGRRVQLRIHDVPIRAGDDLTAALRTLADRPPTALLLADDPILLTLRPKILEFAARRRLPTVCASRGAVEAGCLLSVGPPPGEQYARAARLVHMILKGAAPRDLAVEPPSRLEAAVNLTTAATLRMVIPDRVIASADHVVR
jgi:putative ABC transport system substrate-binding protein